MILVAGGTGFLGSHVVEQLRLAGHEIRVLASGSGDWRSHSVSNLKNMGVDTTVGSILNPRVAQAALSGCNVVINATGSFNSPGTEAGHDVHVEGVKILCQEAANLGINRFIQISCLGANQHSDSTYLRGKWQAEEIVKCSQAYWTIFRPAFMFGERCDFIAAIKPLMKLPFFIPVIGSGLNQLAPVCVEDVAACVVQSIFKRETANQTIDLSGAKSYSLFEFMDLLRKEMGLLKPLLPVTLSTAMRVIKPFERWLPARCLNSEFIFLLTSDCTSSSPQMKQLFQVRGASLEEYLQNILAREQNAVNK